jgi:hypothetical protein
MWYSRVPKLMVGRCAVTRRTIKILASLVAVGVWGGSGLAQDVAPPDENLARLIERFEQQDKEEFEDGLVLETFEVQPSQSDPRRRSMQLSIGEVGTKPGEGPFEEPSSNFLLDPVAPPEAPPVGLNLRLQF